jgi:hypothetical protein
VRQDPKFTTASFHSRDRLFQLALFICIRMSLGDTLGHISVLSIIDMEEMLFSPWSGVEKAALNAGSSLSYSS